MAYNYSYQPFDYVGGAQLSNYSGIITGANPKCPNHRIPLIPFKDGLGQCPDSNYLFRYEEVVEKTKTEMKIVNGELQEVVGEEVKINE